MTSFAYQAIFKAFGLLLLILLMACESEEPVLSSSDHKLFDSISASHSGLDFSNDLIETDTLNYFNYPYIYMGGGVAVADFNLDGLMDVYFTGNMVANRLYINKGDLKFEDVTDKSGTAGDRRWMQGVTVCDINNDGRPDLYISVSGKTDKCPNLLFVNQGTGESGIPTFSEQAADYGLDDVGHSTQAAFFDYDGDGDMDIYVANYPITKFTSPVFYYGQMMKNAKHRDSDHLYRNDGRGRFTDVTEEAGVLNFGLSLSASVSDVNGDGFPDIYVSNDFASPDHFYINNGNGTFSDKIKETTRQTSFYGMGADISDFNNDGLMDIYQLDMAPEDNRRSKENMSGMNPKALDELVESGLHYQYMYNSLQLNRGIDKTGLPQMSNIAWLAGVATTDWSWAPLFADFDLDGWKDIYVTNGTRRDINNNDFFKSIESNNIYFSSDNQNENDRLNVSTLNKMPSEKISNYLFKNNGNLTFTNTTDDWGLSHKSFSNGAAYADFDNDGDLDLIVNNIDEQAMLFQNKSVESTDRNYIVFELEGPVSNRFGGGVKIKIKSDENIQLMEQMTARGFQSAVDPRIFFGLNSNKNIDTTWVTWPDGNLQTIANIKTNQSIVLKYSDAKKAESEIFDTREEKVFWDATDKFISGLEHVENSFNDFGHQVLLPHKMSRFGPALAVGDINGDNLDDIFLGGAHGQVPQLFLQGEDGVFSKENEFFVGEEAYEDLDAGIMDLDTDGDLDLFVVSGGNEFDEGDERYADRIYLNEGGVLAKAENVLPKINASGSCVRPFDFDKDGDLDLFIGGRLAPRHYPYPGRSMILENRLESGELHFVDVTGEVAPGLLDIGMVTDAVWSDVNRDGNVDLFVVGEWMPLTVFEYDGTTFRNTSEKHFSGNTTGWWFSITELGETNGNVEYLAGNLGRNYKYQASPEASFNIYTDDFDANGKNDIVLSYHNFGEEYPVRGRSCSSEQIPAIKKKFKNYETFAVASIEDVYGEKNLEKSTSYKVENFSSVKLIFDDGKLEVIEELPEIAQIAPINDVLVNDFTDDGVSDVVIAGNLFSSESETPRADAGLGLLLKGNSEGSFIAEDMTSAGLFIPYDTKSLNNIKVAGQKGILVGNNNGPIQLFLMKAEEQ